MGGFLDTSMIVRYLTDDPLDLALRATEVIDSDEELYVIDSVIAEVGHVLSSNYQVPREEIVDKLIAFIRRGNIRLHGLEKEFAIQGLLFCRPSGRVSIPNALLWAAARTAGVTTVYTFDQRFPRDGIDVRESLA